MQPILKINLSVGSIEVLDIPRQWEIDFLGGASLGARLLYKKLTPDLDPFSGDAPLLFLNGPLSGTAGPAVGRFVICGLSPATRLWAESNCGGFWGPELRKTGYDGIWIEGIAEEPVYLWIKNGEVQVKPARHLWGLDTYDTQKFIESELSTGKISVASIGPAGENLIPFALILCDHGRVAGRTGLGAVMGSKKLKAIAVQGSRKIPVLDFQTYLPLRSEANRILRSDNATLVLRELGTSSSAEYFDYLGEMPKHYFQSGTPVEDIKVSGSFMKENILAGVSTCHACVIACGRVVRLEDGNKRKGPEYETLVGFGPNLGLNDIIIATQLGELCDRLGVDTISMSNTIGLAYYLYERKIISKKETEGKELTWGNSEPLFDLIKQTVYCQGFGKYLSQGALALGRAFNAAEEAVQVNNLEVAYHDPRGATGMALVYATSPRGACHNQSDYFMVDIWKPEPSIGVNAHDRLGGAEKSASVAHHQDWRTIANALVMCIFANLEPEIILPLINIACGLDWTVQDMLKAGERGWNLKRAINNRLGLTRQNDTLPKSLQSAYKVATPKALDLSIDLNSMLNAYYAARGWDPKSGLPSVEKLKELSLEFVIPDLYPDK